MNKFKLLIKGFALLGAFGLLLSCGGGGGGGGGGGAQLATGTFSKQVNTIDFGDNFIPFEQQTLKLQLLYQASDILGSGNLSTIRMRYGVDNLAQETCPNSTIRLGHTSVTALTTTYASNIEQGQGSMVTVLDNATITIPVGVTGDWFDIPLASSFNYNGADNLVVEFTRPSPCSSNVRVDTESVGYIARTGERPTDANLSLAAFSDTTLNWMQFVFSGGDNEQNFGGILSNSWPFSQDTPRTQNLYLASEIDGSGPITGVGFQMNQVSTAGTFTATVNLGHSILATLGTSFADNFSDTPVTVANAVTFDIPGGIPIGEWFWVPLPDSTFSYNGTDNLIVDVVVSAGSSDTFLRTALIAGRRVRDGDNTSPTGNVNSSAIHAKFRFNGGRVNVVTDAASFSPNMFGTTANGYATLYRASELGTAGTITSIGCRAHIDSVVGSYPSYQLIVGHTTAESLTSPADFVSQHVGYSGTYTIPATLKKGDWIDVPLSAPFAYDGKSNLIVWQGSTAADGSGINQCSFSSIATRYNAHGRTGVPGTFFNVTADRKADISLKITQ